MPAIRRRRLAREDVIEIWSYIAEDNVRAADALVDRIDRAFAFLAMNPRSGRMRPDIGRGIRSFVVRPYIIFYRTLAGGIDVARVMHGARDIIPEDVWRSLAIDED